MTDLPNLIAPVDEESYRRLKEIRTELQRLLQQEEDLLAWRRKQIDEIERLAVAFSITPSELRSAYKSLQRERSRQVSRSVDVHQHAQHSEADSVNLPDSSGKPDSSNQPDPSNQPDASSQLDAANNLPKYVD